MSSVNAAEMRARDRGRQAKKGGKERKRWQGYSSLNKITLSLTLATALVLYYDINQVVWYPTPLYTASMEKIGGSPTWLKLSSHLGVHLHVSLTNVPSEKSMHYASIISQLEGPGQHLIVTATIEAPDQASLVLDHRCTWAIVKPILDDIHSVSWHNLAPSSFNAAALCSS